MQRGLPRARSEAQEARPAQGQIQKPEQGLHRASEQQREVDVHQGPAQGQKVQDKVGPGWLRYQCQDWGTGPRSPTQCPKCASSAATLLREASLVVSQLYGSEHPPL